MNQESRKKIFSYVYPMIHDSCFLILLIVFVHLSAFLYIKDNGLMMDEHYHYNQIRRFMQGNFTLDPLLPMVPGYHFAVSSIGKTLNIQNISYYDAIPFVRGISFILGLLSIFFFYLCARILTPNEGVLRTIQYSFFPLLFPFFPLLYTDMFSLAVIFLAFWLFLMRRYLLSAIIGALSILVRQNNIFWVGFFVATEIFSELLTNKSTRLPREKIIRTIRRLWPYILVPVAIGGFLIVNGRLSMGENTMVRLSFFHFNNLFLILFLFFFFFAPDILARGKQYLVFVKNKWIFLIPVIFLFIPFQVFFVNNHPLNQGTFFLHNLLMATFTSTILLKLIFFIIMVLSLIYLFKVRLIDRQYILLYPFTFAFLLPIWFVEQRYYMIPFSFFLLLRKHGSKRAETATVVLYIAASLYLFWGISHWRFFI